MVDASPGRGSLTISSDTMDLAGDLVQSLGAYLGIEDLATSCSFPREQQAVESLLTKAEELQGTRQRLSADMADHSGVIRSLVVRAEDSRIMADMKSMKKWCSQLYDINKVGVVPETCSTEIWLIFGIQDLVSGYKIRCNNHSELMDTLKQVRVCKEHI